MKIKRQFSIRFIEVNRANLIKYILTLLVIALGINLISNSIFSFKINNFLLLFIGVLLCIGTLLYLALDLFFPLSQREIYKSFFVYDNKNKVLVDVPRYDFSEEVYDYLQSAFVENPALKKQWEREPLGTFGGKQREKESYKILSEAIEYFILEKLSIHLTDYFSDEKFKKDNLKKCNREDIPDILLKNRFLELFSRPMKDRPLFVEDGAFDKDDENTVSAYIPSGARYEKFELILPKKSRIARLKDNEVQIKTSKLNLSFKILFEGYSAYIPFEFKRCILGIKNFREFSVYEVKVEINISINFWSLFSKEGWEYYYWIDSFLENINSKISKDFYFKKINWETAYTVIQYLELQNNK